MWQPECQTEGFKTALKRKEKAMSQCLYQFLTVCTCYCVGKTKTIIATVLRDSLLTRLLRLQ